MKLTKEAIGYRQEVMEQKKPLSYRPSPIALNDYYGSESNIR